MLYDLLGLENAKTIAVIGAGGKTTLLWKLAKEFAGLGERVLVTTSTRIFRPTSIESDRFVSPTNAGALREALAQRGITTAGYPNAEGKCVGLSPELFAEAQKSTARILYEADGAKRLPIKLHRAGEPVIHPGTDATVIVLGLSALGQPAERVCHRWELSEKFAADPAHLIDEQDILALVRESVEASGQPRDRVRILLNQADLPMHISRSADAMQALRAEGYTVCTLSLLSR